MTLILKFFNNQIGYAEWENLRNPDVYCVWLQDERVTVDKFYPTFTLPIKGDSSGWL
jgi:2,3-bisphosphoglycerate-dependent phosphoglycerate mutase